MLIKCFSKTNINFMIQDANVNASVLHIDKNVTAYILENL